MDDFKVGDRVRCVAPNGWVDIGLTGTVFRVTNHLSVDWDNGKKWAIAKECVEKL